MPSRSSDRNSPRRRAHAFTLAELLAVVVVLSMLAGLLASRFSPATPDHRRRSALRGLVTMLSIHRIDAMRAQHHRECVIELKGDRLLVSGATRDARAWSIPPTTFAQGELARSVRFAPDGSASARHWRFVPADPTQLAWTIQFHPLSGTPRATPEQLENAS